MDPSGKQIIVTGGVNGLGRTMVHRLISRGGIVTVLDIDVTGFSSLKKDYPDIQCFACDVTKDDQVVRVAEKFFGDRGAPDVLINNAGILSSEPLIKITKNGISLHDSDKWERVMRSNLSSVFYVTRSFVAQMVKSRTSGVVVNIGSISAAGRAGASAYAAAKAGVHALTHAWARELGPLGIRVIAVAPGFIDTASARVAISETALLDTIRRVPLRRLGKTEEVAAAVLAAIENDFFNGKVFELDGGLTL